MSGLKPTNRYLSYIYSLRQLSQTFDLLWRYYFQGGYGTNLAPTKLVGKLLTFFDSTAHRVVGGLPPPVPGGLPPPVPSTSNNGAQHNEYAYQPGAPKVSNTQSATAMSSLMPSVSMEPISEWTGENKMPNRSISEPDFGRSPTKVKMLCFLPATVLFSVNYLISRDIASPNLVYKSKNSVS